MRKIIFLFLIFFLHADISFAHKIVYLVSPPRSLSVAFLRMMQARGDFTIFHEPSALPCSLGLPHNPIGSWFRPEAPRTFAEVKRRIFSAAEKSPVFVKEISFHLRDFLLQDPELIRNPNIQFVFLLRDPHSSTLSFYKKSIPDFPFPGFSKLVGYEATFDIFQAVQKQGAHPPIFIRTEDLHTHPRETVQELCRKLDIPFLEKSLYWEKLDDQFDALQEWHEYKLPQYVRQWHLDAIQSEGFSLPGQYEKDVQGTPTFSEIKDLGHQKICKEAYEENLSSYKKFIESVR